MTLKRRIFLIFSFSSLVPFLSIFVISYYTIDSIFDNKIKSGIQSNLRQVELSLGDSLSNLNHVSQQLAYGGTIGKQLDEVLHQPKDATYQLMQSRDQLKKELNVITFTNPSIDLTMYYFRDEGKIDFENFPVRDDFSPDKLPLLAEYYGISYYGPHVSMNQVNDKVVLSALRKVDLPDRDDVYVYMETGFLTTQNILNNDQYGGALSHLILDGKGRIAYSEVPEIFSNGAEFPDFTKGEATGNFRGYHWFKQTSNQDWSVVSVISQANYNKEKDRWLLQILVVFLFFLCVTLLLAWLLWKMVYRPLNLFHSEIKWMSQSRLMADHHVQTKIPEFDYLLGKFWGMKEQLRNLFTEIERKEKNRVDLEVEKLLYQINPHFLMNTLDTVHWLAVMNGQDEIDRLVQSLNKLLYYNLGKLGEVSTIEEEIDALKQYLTLQQVRYDFQFDVRIDVEENVLKLPVPRFILQPLVENSLYHGLSDDGYIQVGVRLDNDIQISIQDNGSGMSEETIRELLNSRTVEQKKVGMGIGMNYVKRMLEARYENKAKLEIKSEVGKGTSILLSLPIAGEGD
ncbi:sensor histidine kinase [Paenibacillus hexagrammi]|uniref:histidine kinase n=1 Tax=Paenibacillus hexagrammi TaxID=2908839 RepID=A0ABY3SJY3_9BACL|nr:sensor histidine kinase [Paenibacillus sp. YPD9-1]UJF33549.1 sensor histidine kinase [Paenibacillus sp. YPD9-1]